MKPASYIFEQKGRSRNAELAEAEGKLPLSRAIPAVAAIGKVTRNDARIALECTGPCEWHHTGLYARRTDYYSIDAALRYLHQ